MSNRTAIWSQQLKSLSPLFSQTLLNVYWYFIADNITYIPIKLYYNTYYNILRFILMIYLFFSIYVRHLAIQITFALNDFLFRVSFKLYTVFE